jgi:hypothetical protein
MAERKQYADSLTPDIVMEAFIEFITLVENGGVKNTRDHFNSVLANIHNAAAPDHKQITAAYLEGNSLRVSQKFSQAKTKWKDAGTPIHLSLPRKSRDTTGETIAKMKEDPRWKVFSKLNKPKK